MNGFIAVLLVGVLSCLFTAPAEAGSGAISSGTLTYTATAGQSNILLVSALSGHVRISDSSGVSGSAACNTVSSTVLDCGLESALASVVVSASDGNDTLRVDGPSSASLTVVLDGGSGTGDTVDYSLAPAPVSVDLGSGAASGLGTEQISGVENVVGSPQNDTVRGDNAENVLNGGGGVNTVDYSGSAPGTINLTTGTVSGAGGDTISNFQNVIGSSNADTFIGTTGDNTFS